MADFDIIGQGISGAQPSGLLMGLNPAYQLQQQQLKQSQAFQSGVPTDAQGNPDYGAMANKLMQVGAYDQADKLMNTGIQMDGMRFAQKAASDPLLTGGGALAGAGQGQPMAGQSGADPMSAYAHSIGSIESGNRYDALGPKQASGAQAIGRYQVMSSNVGPWTKEVLGQAMTPEDFLANPQAQDAVFRAKFGQSLQQYSNPFDAASVWFSGKPINRAGNASDSLGTTVPAYIRRFAAGLGSAPQPDAQAQAAPSVPAAGIAAPAGSVSAAPPPVALSQPAPSRPVATAAPAASGSAPQGISLDNPNLPDGPVTADGYQAALKITAQAQNMDPRQMTRQQQNAVTLATQIVTRYQQQNDSPAGVAADGTPAAAGAAPAQVAQNGTSDAPAVSNVHPMGPGGPSTGRQPPPAQAAPQGVPQPPQAALAMPQDAQQQVAPVAIQAPPQASATPRTLPPQGNGSLMVDPTMGGLLRGQWVGNPGGYALALRQRAAAYSVNPYTKATGEQFAALANQIDQGIAREGLITPEMKNYAMARQQGFAGTMMDFHATEAKAQADAQNSSRLASDVDPSRIRFAGQQAEATAAGTAQGQNSPDAAAAAAAKAGQVAEASKAGAALGELPAQYAKTASAAQATSQNLDEMLTAAQGFVMGAGASMDQTARKTMQAVLSKLGVSDPALNSTTASYEDYGKIAGVLNRNAAAQVGGRTGVQEMQLIGATLPSPEQSYDGFRSVASSLKGTADYQVAKMQAAAAYKAPGGPGNGSLNGFDAYWTANANPSAFWLNRLSVDQPDLFAHSVQQLGQTPQGRALLVKAKAGMAWASSKGLFN